MEKALARSQISICQRNKTPSLLAMMVTAIVFTMVLSGKGWSQDAQFEPSFKSLKYKTVNMRVGPSRQHPIKWAYKRKGLPVEIIQQSGLWRQIRDPRGGEGWVKITQLTSQRVVIVKPWELNEDGSADNSSSMAAFAMMYQSPDSGAKLIAKFQPGALANLNQCGSTWCQLSAKDDRGEQFSGYMKKADLWGVYPDEVFEN